MKLDADGIVAVVSILSLGFVGLQIFQANRLQRNQVEQEYLRRAYELMHVPYLALQNVAFGVDDLRRLGDAEAGSAPRYSPAVAAILDRYRADMSAFAAALQNATVFAESLDRIHGNGEYREVLTALREANIKGFALQKELFGKVLKGELRGGPLASDPHFVASVRASESAATVISEKLIRMYRVVDAQP